MEPASQRDWRRKRGGESDDLEAWIEGAQLEEKQLDEMAALGLQRVGFVDDHEVDTRLLQRETGKPSTWPSRRQRFRMLLAFSTVLIAI